MALYRHFRSMEHLLNAAWSETHGRMEGMLWSAAARATNRVDELALLIRGFAGFAHSHPGLYGFIVATAAEPETFGVTDQVRASMGRLVDLIERGQREGVFRPDLDPAAAAGDVLFVMLGLASLMALPRGSLFVEDPGDQLVEATIQRVLADLLPKV